MKHSSVTERLFSVRGSFCLLVMNIINDPQGDKEDAYQNLPWFRTHNWYS